MDWIKVRNEKINKFRVGLHPEYQKIYDFIAAKLPVSWAPYFGLRTIEEQQELYNKGRSNKSIELGERIITNARPGESLHNFGLASDFTIWDLHAQPVWNHNEWRDYASVVRMAGGTWGGDWISFNDKPHNQFPTKLSGKELNKIRLEKGIDEALKHAISNRV